MKYSSMERLKLYIYLSVAFLLSAILSLYPSFSVNWINNGEGSLLEIGLIVLSASIISVGLASLIEIKIRLKISKLLESGLQNPINDISNIREVESVNYTTSIEKYTWASADILKYSATTFAIFCLLIITSFNGFIASVVVLVVFGLITFLLVPYVKKYRLKLELSSRTIVQSLINSSLKATYNANNSISKEIEKDITSSLFEYTKYRKIISFYRTLFSIFSIIITAIIISSGISLYSTDSAIGVVVIAAGIFSMGTATRLVDSIVVFLSESIHVTALKYSFKRNPLLTINKNTLSKLHELGSSIIISGENGSGKSVFLRELYYTNPDAVKYFGSNFSFDKTRLSEITMGSNDCVLIFDESIQPKLVNWFLSYIKGLESYLVETKTIVLIVDHGSTIETGIIIRQISIDKLKSYLL